MTTTSCEQLWALGALGYVHKKDALSELLLAVDSVLRSELFVSSSNGFKFTDT
jgi:DNA-binding NarL/FixJ family response regulator